MNSEGMPENICHLYTILMPTSIWVTDRGMWWFTGCQWDPPESGSLIQGTEKSYLNGSACAFSACMCPCWHNCTSCTGKDAPQCESECDALICWPEIQKQQNLLNLYYHRLWHEHRGSSTKALVLETEVRNRQSLKDSISSFLTVASKIPIMI